MFLNCRGCVHKSCSSESTMQSATKSIVVSARLCLWFSCCSLLHTFILIAVQTSITFSFIWALLCVASPSRAVIGMRRDKRDRYWKRVGSWIKFDETEADMGTCIPIHFVVSVSLYESSLTQIDSKSNFGKFLNSICTSLYGVLDASSFSKSFCLSSWTLFG